ncbi:MAG: ABC transporter ATP-binding protein [Planctomycetia bacterium]|nr:ABC transporter ATP-binding protein [Planctomycetia bacterium]
MPLTFEHVTKFYGPVIGVNDISCQIGPGITGLLGANGAGKSTLLKLASGQLRPTLGRVRLNEHDAWSTAAKRILGFSPDINQFYEEMTGFEFVYTMARLHGYSRRIAREQTQVAIDEVGMADRSARRIAGCSHGMRQRIKLAQALVHDPEILLLDEPMTGIDPGGRREFGELLGKLAERGKTVLVSSHLLTEVEQLTNSILMIARGRILAWGTLREIRAMLDDQPFCVEVVSEQPRRWAEKLVGANEVEAVEMCGERLLVRTREPQKFFALVNRLAVDERLPIDQLTTLDGGADAVFGYLQQRSA